MTKHDAIPPPDDPPAPEHRGTPGYTHYIEIFTQEQQATEQALEISARAHRQVAKAHREIAEHHDAIADAQERLSESVPDADQAGAELTMWAREHDRTNEFWALREDRRLNVQRDDAQRADHAQIQQLAAKLDAFMAEMRTLLAAGGPCATCPAREAA